MKSLFLRIRRTLGFAYPKIRPFTVLFIFLIVPFFQFPCFSATVELSWDQNSDASYYIVYWGETSGVYTNNSRHVTSPSTTFSATVEDGKTFYFAVKAFNECGNSSDYSQEIIYTPVNQAPPPTNLSPVANAGTDQTVTEGNIVSLNAGESSDPDDGIASYQWTQVSGSSVTITNPTSSIASFTAPDIGQESETLTFRVSVSDYGGLTAYDDCLVSVSPTTQTTGTSTVNIDWTQNDDASYYTVYWGETSGAYTFSSEPIYAPISSYVATVEAGKIYYFAIKAFSDCGNSSDFSDEVYYLPENQAPPVVNLTPVANAGSDQTVSEGISVSLDAGGSSDPDDGIASYQWVQISGTTVTLSSPNSAASSFTAPNVGFDGEILTFRITVKDQGGLSSSDDCRVIVSNVNQVPVADAGMDQTVSEMASVILNAGGSSDPDDGIASYQWSQVSGTTVTLSNADSDKASFTAPPTGLGGETLIFRITIKDQGGLSSSDDCRVIVSNVNQVPVADAGLDQTVSEKASVILNAGGSSDPDDGIASYKWSQIAGTSVTLSNTDSDKASFTAPSTGLEGETLIFRITITDQGGLSSSDDCRVIVSNVNQVPVADAGMDQTVFERESVILNASESTDPDDGIVSYQWSQIAGTIVTLSNADSNTASFTAPSTGTEGETLTFRIMVTDQGGLASSDDCLITVSNINLPPVAYAGIDQTVSEGASVTLEGNDSYDPDGNIVSYTWTQVSGTNVTLTAPNSSGMTFTAPATGPEGETLKFQVTVTDDTGLSSSDDCLITVSNVNQPPVAYAGLDLTASEGDSVTLEGNDSYDSDDGIVTYQWAQLKGTTVKLLTPTSSNTSFTAPETGPEGEALSFRITVTDQAGLSAFDECTVIISNINQPPIANAGQDLVADEGGSVTLSANDSYDPDGGILSYQWTQTTGTTVSLSNPNSADTSFTAPDTGIEGDVLTFRMTVKDAGGLSASDECTITVSNVNHPPVANAGIDQTAQEGASVTLLAQESYDPDGDIDSYQWVQTTGTTVSLSDSSSAAPSFITPETGAEGETLSFRLTVMDQFGLSATDDCLVKVTNINEGPIANAGQDLVVDEGGVVTLNAGSSSDPDDGISVYQWTQTSGNSVILSDPTSIYPTFTAPETEIDGETLTFKLTVTDFGNLSSSAECRVRVSNVNKIPVADAGPDQSVDEGLSVSLDASASTDADGEILSYLWAQTSGPSVTLSDPDSASPSFVAPDTGVSGETLTFSLTVSDSDGLSASDECSVSILFVNEPPFADAGEDQTVDEGNEVALSASKSSDPDDGIASYLWFQTQGPTVTLSSNTEVNPTFTAPEASTEGLTLTFQLVVEDKQGIMAADTCDVLIKDSAIVETPVEPVSPEFATAMLSEFPTIEVLDTQSQHQAWLKIGWAEYTALNGEARVATGDIDNDGNDEIIIGLAAVPDNPAIPGGFFQVLDHDYSHLAWGYVNWPEYNAINGETWPACGDLDGDGDDEIVIGLGPGGEGTYEVFDFDSGQIYHKEWGKTDWPEYNAASGETRPACGDIDQDDKDEIIVGLGPVYNVSEMPGGYFEIIDSDFSHLMWWKVNWPDYNAVNGETWPTIGNLSGMAKDTLALGLGQTGVGRTQILIYGLDSLDHLSWLQVDWPEYTDISGETRPAFADLNQDGRDEIMTGLAPVKTSRSIPNGLFQINDPDLAVLSWGQVSWDDYNVKNGESRLAFGFSQGESSIYVSLGERQEKVNSAAKTPPGLNK